MSATTMTSKGQITIPKDIGILLDLNAGDKVNFVVDDHGLVNLVPVTRQVSVLRGIVRKPKSSVSIEDMNSAIKHKASKQEYCFSCLKINSRFELFKLHHLENITGISQSQLSIGFPLPEG